MMITEKPSHFDKRNSSLLWNEESVFSTGDIKSMIGSLISENNQYFLPYSIVIWYDQEISSGTINRFIEDVAYNLSKEFDHREERKQRFVDLNLLSSTEFERIITQHRMMQPWVLYYSRNGGLGDYDEKNNSEAKGMIPCAAMRNHGVAWQVMDGIRKMWLVTSRKVNKEWDWDSDLGHESAHACFAPIPLFIQSLHVQSQEMYELTKVESKGFLTPNHIARICYMLTEIAVIAVRGERRDTISGLPVAENPHEFRAFLNLNEQLMPGLGFIEALEQYNKISDGFVDVNNGDAIFYIGAPCLKAISRIKEYFSSFGIPEVSMFSPKRDLLTQ